MNLSFNFSLDAIRATLKNFFHVENSTEESKARDSKIGSAVKGPLRLAVAFGLLMTSVNAAFVHHNLTGPDSVVNMKTSVSPEISVKPYVSPYNEIDFDSVMPPRLPITSIGGETECETMVRIAEEKIFNCPPALELYTESFNRGASIVCTTYGGGSFSNCNPKDDQMILSVKKGSHHRESEYVVGILQELSKLESAEKVVELENKKCSMTDHEYAYSSALHFHSAIKDSEAIEAECIAKWDWPEDFHLEDLRAREFIEDAVSFGDFDEVLEKIKNFTNDEELKELENAEGEEKIELAIKFFGKALKEHPDENLKFRTYYEMFIEEWKDKCLI